MADEKKEEVVEATVEEKPQEEKKENSFKKFLKKTKSSIDEKMLELNIKNKYSSDHKEFNYYAKDEFGSSTYYGEREENAIIVFGEVEAEKDNVIIDKDGKAFYVVSTEKTTVTTVYEGVDYERPGTKIVVDENVEEVNVIKCGKRYFIYKGEKK